MTSTTLSVVIACTLVGSILLTDVAHSLMDKWHMRPRVYRVTKTGVKRKRVRR